MEEQEFVNEDFNLEEEYKPAPLIIKSNYTGNVTGVKKEADVIIWDVVLEGNGGAMSDGETPIDGYVSQYRNWLPRTGDDKTLTKDGSSTKRQSKINMLAAFADKMGIKMNTVTEIEESINSGDWLGIPVVVQIAPEEYQGVVRNKIQRMSAQK